MSDSATDNRPLTADEYQLIRWMLKNGAPDKKQFLTQLEIASVTPCRCPCGCASIELSIAGQDKPTGGLQALEEFMFGTDDNLNGIFVYAKNGVLAGVEVYGMAGEAARSLPRPEELRSYG